MGGISIAMIPVHRFTRWLPFGLGPSGDRRDRLLRVFSRLFPLPTGLIQVEGLSLDPEQANQRLLAYFYHNILRFYRNSLLYRFMSQVLRPGEVFIDIGANLGIFSLLARSLGCEVILFEPDPAHALFLERNRSRFGRFYPLALSDRETRAEFYRGDHRHPDAGSLVPSLKGWAKSPYQDIVMVQTSPLDQVLKDPALIQRINLVKIDVEGSEAAVVKGMTGILRQKAVTIWCEVRNDRSDRNPGSCNDVTNILLPLGYRPYVFNGQSIDTFNGPARQQTFDLVYRLRS